MTNINKNTVNLYMVTTTYYDPYYKDHWSLTPAQTDEYQDEGPVEFELPAGYHVGETVDGNAAIFDSNDRYVPIETRNGEPYLVDDSYRKLTRSDLYSVAVMDTTNNTVIFEGDYWEMGDPLLASFDGCDPEVLDACKKCVDAYTKGEDTDTYEEFLGIQIIG